jgi:hypothetical protein
MLTTLTESAYWKAFEKTCGQIQNNQPITTELDLRELSTSPLMSDARRLQMNNCRVSEQNTMQGLCPFGTGEVFEKIRTGLKPATFYANLMLKVYRDYLVSIGTPPGDLKVKMNFASSSILDTTASSAQLIGKFAPIASKYVTCYKDFIKAENKLSLSIIEEFEAWTKTLYVRAKSENKADFQKSIRAELSKGYYKSEFEIIDDKLKFSKFDILIKISALINKTQPSIHYEVAEALGDSNVTHSLKNSNPLENNPTELFSLNDQSNEFSKKLLIRTFGDDSGKGWISWFAQWTSPQRVMTEWIETLTGLYRLDSKKFPIELLLTANRANYDFAHISPRQQVIFEKLNRTQKVDNNDNTGIVRSMDESFVNRSSQKVFGIFDFINQSLTSEVLAGIDLGPSDSQNGVRQRGESYLPNYIMPTMIEAREFAKFKQKVSTSLFQISQKTTVTYQNYYQIQLNQLIKNYEQFRNIIQNQSTPTSINLSRFKTYNLEKLSREEDLRFSSILNSFVEKTNGFYSKLPVPSADQNLNVQQIEPAL